MFRRNWLLAALSFVTVGLFGKKAEAGNSITFRNGSTLHFSGEDVALRGVDTADDKPKSVVGKDTLLCVVSGGMTLSHQACTSMRPVTGPVDKDEDGPGQPFTVIEQETLPPSPEMAKFRLYPRARRFSVMPTEYVGTVDQMVAQFRGHLEMMLSAVSVGAPWDESMQVKEWFGHGPKTQAHLRYMREKYPPDQYGVSIIPWDHNGRCAELAAQRKIYDEEEMANGNSRGSSPGEV